ncbi:2-aminoethylphosphonate--pyruvate transaminase, partial [Striga asiatica]
LPSKRPLPPHDYSNVIFILDYLNPGSGDSRLHIVTALDWDQLIIVTVKYSHITLELTVDLVQIALDFSGSAANYVVKRVPSGIAVVLAYDEADGPANVLVPASYRRAECYGWPHAPWGYSPHHVLCRLFPFWCGKIWLPKFGLDEERLLERRACGPRGTRGAIAIGPPRNRNLLLPADSLPEHLDDGGIDRESGRRRRAGPTAGHPGGRPGKFRDERGTGVECVGDLLELEFCARETNDSRLAALGDEDFGAASRDSLPRRRAVAGLPLGLG